MRETSSSTDTGPKTEDKSPGTGFTLLSPFPGGKEFFMNKDRRKRILTAWHLLDEADEILSQVLGEEEEALEILAMSPTSSRR